MKIIKVYILFLTSLLFIACIRSQEHREDLIKQKDISEDEWTYIQDCVNPAKNGFEKEINCLELHSLNHPKNRIMTYILYENYESMKQYAAALYFLDIYKLQLLNDFNSKLINKEAYEKKLKNQENLFKKAKEAKEYYGQEIKPNGIFEPAKNAKSSPESPTITPPEIDENQLKFLKKSFFDVLASHDNVMNQYYTTLTEKYLETYLNNFENISIITIFEIHNLVCGYRSNMSCLRHTYKYLWNGIEGGPEVADMSQVKLSIDNMIINYLSIRNSKETDSKIAAAAYLFCRFIHIHPFKDGNGRTARVLLAMSLKSAGFPVIPIITEDIKYSHEYARAMDIYFENLDTKPFEDLIKNRIKTLIGQETFKKRKLLLKRIR